MCVWVCMRILFILFLYLYFDIFYNIFFFKWEYLTKWLKTDIVFKLKQKKRITIANHLRAEKSFGIYIYLKEIVLFNVN